MEGVTEEMATGGGENYLVVGLAVGIPCGVIILALLVAVVAIIVLLIWPSSSYEEVEATYMRRRFQGLSLEEQRKMAENQKKKKRKSERITTRRSSSATESSKSSLKLSPYSKRAKIRQDNPFGLQEWQLKMSGIDVSPSSDEASFMDEDSPYRRNPIGALNPLMLEDSTADYEPAHKSSSEHRLSGDEGSSSSDSMNPYDD